MRSAATHQIVPQSIRPNFLTPNSHFWESRVVHGSRFRRMASTPRRHDANLVGTDDEKAEAHEPIGRARCGGKARGSVPPDPMVSAVLTVDVTTNALWPGRLVVADPWLVEND